MNIFRKALASVIAVGLVLTLVVGFSGCSSDAPIGPNTSASALQGKIVNSDVGPVTLLKINKAIVQESLSKTDGEKYFAEKFIVAAEGGEITVGNPSVGVSKVTFQPGDLPEDLTISMQWASGDYCDSIFNPHGITFSQPVTVELSYKSVDLTGINEDDLEIFYYNESLQIWEQIGGTVDKTAKTVIGTLEHFSRYAIVKT